MILFEFDPLAVPGCADENAASIGMEHFQKSSLQSPESKDFFTNVMASPPALKLSRAIFGNSPFLTQCWLNDLSFTQHLLEVGPNTTLSEILSTTQDVAFQGDEGQLKRHLRVQKRRIALTTAVADLSTVWDLFTITKALSDFADAAVAVACSFQLTALVRRGKLTLVDPDDPQKGSGLVVLGMGKLGGQELNYSSDIDLIILFDPEHVNTPKPDEMGTTFVRLARGVVSLLDERTADGYVFRTDLRLRPDPGSTPLALSTLAAEAYYESIGQNWERAAMIKARVIAGDQVAGAEFLQFLKPFIWRSSLDFAAIQDIQSIKRQINTHHGGDAIKLLGHNVKLGRGGIREIEFYAQTQQLIWGGRNRDLRTIATIPSLYALVDAELAQLENVKTLEVAYHFLRNVEHRLQMVDDAQTHTLPDTQDGIARIATFLGYENSKDFQQELLSTLSQVEHIYAQLFEANDAEDQNPSPLGSWVFTGADTDPDTLENLAALGYENVQAIDTAVRGWHHGHYRATRSTRAQQILTELMPNILTAMANTTDPDSAFLRFDEFLSKLPAGVQLFSMFQSNPILLEFLADIMGTAPRLAEYLAQKADVLDGFLTPGFFEALPTIDEYQSALEACLNDSTCMEDTLDISRRWTKDQKFQVGMQVLRGTINEQQSQAALTSIAESVLRALQPRVEDEFALRHGRVPGGALAVIAFGKLGGREKTPTSDMDLTFVYDCDDEASQSDGPKTLATSQYFARLSQRLINALSAPTAQGALYEVDMRLRPSGNAGPLATRLSAFEHYQHGQAWTWEHMALTRARVITGSDALAQKIDTLVHGVLTAPRDSGQLVVNVDDMRTRMDAERHTDLIWSIKDYRGGLVDIEFIAQYLQLRHGEQHPEILSPTTSIALTNLQEANLLDPKTASFLRDSLSLWQSLQGLLRLTIDIDTYHTKIPESLKRRISTLAQTGTLTLAKQALTERAQKVLNIYDKIITAPATEARPNVKPDLHV